MSAALVLCIGAFVATAEVTTTDASGPTDCECQKIFLPVCGEDNVTYNNECDATCANQKVSTKGKCPSIAAIQPRFSHTKEKNVQIGATGKVDITVSNSMTLSVKLGENQQLELRGNVPEGAKLVKDESSADGRTWKFFLKNDPTDLTIMVLPKDCVPIAKATTSPATTAPTDTSTGSPTATGATEASTSSPTTTSAANEDYRRLEANDDGSATESIEEDDEEDSTETYTFECETGLVCNTSLKSCESETPILSVGNAGRTGNNSNAVQNSACPIVAAMVAYLMM